MKPSLARNSPGEDFESDDNEDTPTALPARPALVRSPVEKVSNSSERYNSSWSDRPETASISTSSSDDSEDVSQSGVSEERGGSNGTEDSQNPNMEDVAKMKDAMNAKLLLQQRMRKNYGSPRPGDGSNRRVSARASDAITQSPSIDATVAQPLRTDSNQSTESAGSSRTIRANDAATSAEDAPLRTPSYPFPYVPGSPRTSRPSFHQPFTALSPTTGSGPAYGDETPGKPSGRVSGAGTPAANANTFMPPGAFKHPFEDPRFPTPNMYDVVLQLNAEPGLEQWWATVTNLMHDHYKAERVSLLLPHDASDINNVPWGQKATFSMNGPEEFVPHDMIAEQESEDSSNSYSLPNVEDLARDVRNAELGPQKLHRERLRPRLEARHSYAGHNFGAQRATESSARPSMPPRTATHTAGITGRRVGERLPAKRLLSSSTTRQGSYGEPAFSSIAGALDAGPYAEIFPALRALDHEARPLIESDGISRVLERGKVVTVTRDYAPDESDPSSSEASSTGFEDPRPNTAAARASGIMSPKSAVYSYQGLPVSRDYEEYEQYAPSPWSESPAPSPAIQADEEQNPFFATGEQQVENSFNPAVSPKDYSQLGQVEAIGVDRASTVIHIPLIHPTISQPMSPFKQSVTATGRTTLPRRSDTLDGRKAPIAILSVLSSVVPYPQSLTQSLTHLGPHLATSLAFSQQFSRNSMPGLTIRHRRTTSGHIVSSAPMTVEPVSLDDVRKAGVGPSRSLSSITSPSEYSGHSKHSPTNSIAGTPGWDPANYGWKSSRLTGSTPEPLANEQVDNYFALGKRPGQRVVSSKSGRSAKSGYPEGKTTGSESKSVTRGSSLSAESDLKASSGERKILSGTSQKADRSPLLRSSKPDRSSPPSSGIGPPHRPALRHSVSQFSDWTMDKRHSQLHSYGADFHASFGGLPAATDAEAETASAHKHGRKPSYSAEMPPPSERLLRTIIDSLPVQIFTAEPDTGRLTWVNAKFLAYRGLEASAVLKDPWQAIHADDRAGFMSAWQRSLRSAQQLQQKVRLERFDRSYRWFYVRAAPLTDKRQKIVHWIGTMMDVHEQHLAEANSARQQETAASEAKYRALANSSPQIVFAVDKKRGVTFCNTQWVQYSGQSEEQARGVGFMDHVHPDDLVKCTLPTFDQGSDVPKNVPTSLPPELNRAFSASQHSSSGSSETERGGMNPESSPITGQMPQRKLSELASVGILKVSRDTDGRASYSTEVRLRSKEGEYKWHLVRVLLAEPLMQTDGEETWYGTCTDISDHKALERDLKETMDEKSRFLSNMSHEIRTPLNGITGMVNFLIDTSLTSEQMEHVNIIRASTEGLRGLINDILDLSKAEAGMIQLNVDWLYVRALIEEVNDLTSAMAIDKGLELSYLVEEDVPTQVKGDRFRIRQILLNVVGNAIKFTQRGEVFVRCSTHVSDYNELGSNETFIKFEVIDTGRGFTDKEAENLFKRFSQIDGSSTRQHGGSGLGLAISEQLTHLHGGDMSAKGEPNKGATFWFTIKTSLPSDSDQPPTPAPTPGVSIPILPISQEPVPNPGSVARSGAQPAASILSEQHEKPLPRFALEHTKSPSPYAAPSPDVIRETSSISSAGSGSSIARTSSYPSQRSSASSLGPDLTAQSTSIKLTMPSDPPTARRSASGSLSSDAARLDSSGDTLRASSGSLTPPIYSILVLCPLKYSREATVQHIDKTIPKTVPHQITARESLADCRAMLSGEDPVMFTHIIVNLQDVEEVVSLMREVLSLQNVQGTSIVVITDLAQRKGIMERASDYDYDSLAAQRRLRFLFKPLKPSRFAVIFDPQKEREMSYDRNHDSAQQVALTQKQVFEDLKKQLGGRDKRVLLVEDNRTNQLVVLKFLSKVAITAETATDGVECTEKVFGKPIGYYSIILCDLQMPNKDGYQTCKEIRQKERQDKQQHIPIIALSANVLGDVYEKCVSAGFNSFLTKPVDFKELSTVLMTFMDPSDPSKPHDFMKVKRRRH